MKIQLASTATHSVTNQYANVSQTTQQPQPTTEKNVNITPALLSKGK